MPEKLSLSDRIRAQKQSIDKAAGGKASTAGDQSKQMIDQKQKEVQQKASLMSARVQQKSQAIKAEAPAPAASTNALTPEEVTAVTASIAGLKTRYEDLVRRVQMTDIISETTSLANQIEALPEEITAIRSRGYIFHSYLENKIEVLANQWDEVNDRVEIWLEQESEELDDDLAQADRFVTKLTSGSPTNVHKGLAEQFTSELDKLETLVKASEEKIRVLYDSLTREVSQTRSQLSKIRQYLDWAEAASFRLESGESVFIAAEAEWDDKRDKPDGFMFVTNRRILFEQNEKTGKKLGFFGGKQTQELLWETPLSSIEKITPEDKGLFGGKDLVHLKLGAGAPYAEITVEVKGGIDSKFWAQQINRAVKGHINQESTVEPDPNLIERLRKAPTECPNCGGMLPRIEAHTTEVSCKFCGTTVRI